MKKFLFVSFIFAFAVFSCKSTSPLAKTWQTTYEENGKKMQVESVFGEDTFSSYATWENVPRTEVMRGTYKATENEITVTTTHEYNPETEKLEELPEPKVYTDTYSINKDTLELGKQLFKKK